ncbi:hypothetical protein VOLCADRAFT_85894 [Volvox carteri f. nagariensis]|uniref:Uncharacterized protein n=1 Tax=Volvox carteri f. nagariensis TaxID=3068 RepID=D8THA1_VOLCA|nr:uncharacterized protein VOLCADRAFT_85894 [Volvox carteri f. nagariensis]EFJ52674.1 hypothetical protein VOLCADRAFT_85894 [Volvox carteri f. nagariensis]|eukprot:XP_002945679.1 hypothetical protein VOLCADRAFT_85894 [Volvox carteri f. nagariensis]
MDSEVTNLVEKVTRLSSDQRKEFFSNLVQRFPKELHEQYNSARIDKAIVDSVKQFLDAIRRPGGQIKNLQTAISVISTAVSGPQIREIRGNTDALHRRVGLKKSAIRAAGERFKEVVGGASTQPARPYRLIERSDKIPKGVVEEIACFWYNNSVLSPHARDSVKIPGTAAVYFPRRIVQKTYRQLYLDYLHQHSTAFHVSFGFFVGAKPGYVKPFRVPDGVEDELRHETFDPTVKVRQICKGQDTSSDRVEYIEKRCKLSQVERWVLNDFGDFAQHHFSKVWQRRMFHMLSDPDRQLAHELVTTADFSEKLVLKYQNEPMAMHWAGVTMCILVVVVYMIDNSRPSGAQHVESHFFIGCGDCKQDASYVNLSYKMLLDDITSRPDMKGMRVQHDYCEAGHGKGLHDSEGGIIKLRRPDGILLKEATDVVDFLNRTQKVPAAQEPLTGTGNARINERFFHLVTPHQLQVEQFTCISYKTVQSTQKFHSVLAAGPPRTIHVRKRSCSCDFCRHFAAGVPSATDRCAFSDHVDDWCCITLEPSTEAATAEPESSTVIDVDTVIALQNDEPDDFPGYDYCLMVVKGFMELNDVEWTDGDGKTFLPPADIIKGRWLYHDGSHLSFFKDGRPRLSGALKSDLLMANVPVHEEVEDVYTITEEMHQEIIARAHAKSLRARSAGTLAPACPSASAAIEAGRSPCRNMTQAAHGRGRGRALSCTVDATDQRTSPYKYAVQSVWLCCVTQYNVLPCFDLSWGAVSPQMYGAGFPLSICYQQCHGCKEQDEHHTIKVVIQGPEDP